jgi:hypothetical protein
VTALKAHVVNGKIVVDEPSICRMAVKCASTCTTPQPTA